MLHPAKQETTVKYVASGFLLGSLYHPEGGGCIFQRNVCSLFSGLHSVVTPEGRAVPLDHLHLHVKWAPCHNGTASSYGGYLRKY
jgi:hypothetical protein